MNKSNFKAKKKKCSKSRLLYDFFRGRGLGRGGPMGSMPRGFSGPPALRRGLLRGIMNRGMGFRLEFKLLYVY